MIVMRNTRSIHARIVFVHCNISNSKGLCLDLHSECEFINQHPFLEKIFIIETYIDISNNKNNQQSGNEYALHK